MLWMVENWMNGFVLVACIVALLWYHNRRKYDHWKNLRVKYLKPTPFLGNTSAFVLRLSSLHEMYDRLYQALADEPFAGIYHIYEPMLLVKDPQLVSAVLVSDFKHFSDRGAVFFNVNKKLNPLNEHLFAIEGKRWKVLRQKLGPIFTIGKLRSMHAQILECVGTLNAFVETRISNGSADFDSKELFDQLTIDVIGSCAFGIDCNSLKSNDRFYAICKDVFNERIANVIRMALTTFGTRLLDLLQISDFPQRITDFFFQLTTQTIEYRRENGVTRNDIIQMLMDLQNSHVNSNSDALKGDTNVLNDEKFDETDIAANTFLFFIAGFETTSSTLSFCLYELAHHRDVQRRLRAEVQRARKKYGASNDNEYFKELVYMDAVLTETLRKYPPGVVLTRQCTEDYTIPGTKVHLAANTKLLIPVWSIHHDPKIYANPENFDPQRFYVNDEYVRPRTGTYLPFGDGPRNCLGKGFANMEMKTVLSDLILQYEFAPCAKTKAPLKYMRANFVLKTESGTWVNITKIKITDEMNA